MPQETGEQKVVAPRGMGQPMGLSEPFVWERGAGDPGCCDMWLWHPRVLLIWQLLKSCCSLFSLCAPSKKLYIKEEKKKSKKSWEISIK